MRTRNCFPVPLATLSLAITVVFMGLAASSGGQTPASPADDALARGFQDPPDPARPRVWWHWMNGNVTRGGSPSTWSG